MIFYILANLCSALSSVLNKYFIRNGYFEEGVKMLDVTFHSNIIGLFFFINMYFFYKFRGQVKFSLKKTFFNKSELMQVILFSIPIYAASLKIGMMQKMPITYVEISTMIKPFCVLCLALIFLREKFYPYYLIYAFAAVLGFFVANFSEISSCDKSGNNGDLFKVIYYLLVASLGDITRRYYCKKWDDALQAICVEIIIFSFYGSMYLLFNSRFSLSILMNPCTICYSVVTYLHHVCIIHGVKNAHSVAALELLNFSKIIFTLCFCSLILHEHPSYYKIIGAFIIGISLIMFTMHKWLKQNREKTQEF